jgi:hypothetical protein
LICAIENKKDVIIISIGRSSFPSFICFLFLRKNARTVIGRALNNISSVPDKKNWKLNIPETFVAFKG